MKLSQAKISSRMLSPASYTIHAALSPPCNQQTVFCNRIAASRHDWCGPSCKHAVAGHQTWCKAPRDISHHHRWWPAVKAQFQTINSFVGPVAHRVLDPLQRQEFACSAAIRYTSRVPGSQHFIHESWCGCSTLTTLRISASPWRPTSRMRKVPWRSLCLWACMPAAVLACAPARMWPSLALAPLVSNIHISLSSPPPPSPLFPGFTEAGQISVIVLLNGTPTASLILLSHQSSEKSDPYCAVCSLCWWKVL